ncbi:MAG TPA: response regulator [Streptosporangiaceae bacterium]
MSSDEVARLLGAVAQLLGVLVWPAVVLLFIFLFRRALGNFLGNLGELSFRTPGGLEATARSREAAAALGAAVARRTPGESGEEPNADPREIAEAIPSPREQRRLQGSRILWVDDRPGNNVFERQALEALGIDIDISTSTEGALEILSRRSYDLIISDMGRPPDARAGYTLLDRLRKAGNSISFIIYASSRAPEHIREARQHGAIGCTNRPQELVEMVTSALTAKR